MEDLMLGFLGNGITVWDRSRLSETGDYLIVAHISDDGIVSWRKVELSDEARRQITEHATTKTA